MKTFLYLLILDLAFNFGWLSGLAGYPTTKWFMAPAFCFLLGGIIRMYWMKP